MAHKDPLIVRLDAFEGPLDLLLFLIQSHELDVSKVSVSVVTDQYLQTIRWAQELNFDVASEFLLMAATLLLWKSKAVLPQEADLSAAQSEDDGMPSQDELIRRLQWLQRIRATAQDLSKRPLLGEHVFIKPPEKPPIEKIWREMNVTQLAMGYQDILVRSRKRGTILKKETVSISTKIAEFAHRLTKGQREDIRRLMSAHPDRPEIVVTFLASIELSKHQKVHLTQEGTYQPIYMELLQDLDTLNLGLVSEFEVNPAEEPPAQIEGTA